MKTSQFVLAACVALAACSEEPAKEMPAVPAAPAVTRDMLGGRDVGLAALSMTWGPGMEVFGKTQSEVFLSPTVGNATDQAVNDPWMRCLVGNHAQNPALVTLQLKGVVPVGGTATFPDTRTGWLDDKTGDVSCAVLAEEPAPSSGPNRAPEGAIPATKPVN